MDASSVPQCELKFESPPVQQVRLAVYFEPVMTVGSFHLMPILSQWKEDYPQLDESPHIHNWRPRTEPEAEEGEGRRYVTPNFILQTADGQRSLQVQQDRLVLLWRFEAEGSPKEYVGYASLRAELEKRIAQLSHSVKEVAGVDLIPERVDTTYQNLVDVAARDFCVGILTSWSTSRASFETSTAYSGMRLAGFADDDDDVETLVAIDTGPDGEGTDFTIDVERTIKEGEDYLVALDDAHQVVLRIFVQLASADMMSSWGRR
jgi:uncharacterized protein (TIGR04255 family)